MIQNIVIAGAGTMGYSMAQIFARYNYSVTLYDLNDQALDNARTRIAENTATLVSQNELTKEQGEAIENSFTYTTSTDCFKDCDLVVECIVERLDVKKDFYKLISPLTRDDTIIASNTSGLSINAMAECVTKPERFLGMHWFNPSHLILLIEIIKGDATRDDVAQEIYDLAIKIGKKPVMVNQDVPGFAANRIQLAVLREALSLVEKGVVSKEGIDDLMKYGLGFRYACLGPLETVDFGGIDTFYHVASYLMQDLDDRKTIPAELAEHFNNGELGVKTGKGFYDYSDGKDVEKTKERDEKLLKVFNALYK